MQELNIGQLNTSWCRHELQDKKRYHITIASVEPAGMIPNLNHVWNAENSESWSVEFPAKKNEKCYNWVTSVEEQRTRGQVRIEYCHWNLLASPLTVIYSILCPKNHLYSLNFRYIQWHISELPITNKPNN